MVDCHYKMVLRHCFLLKQMICLRSSLPCVELHCTYNDRRSDCHWCAENSHHCVCRCRNYLRLADTEHCDGEVHCSSCKSSLVEIYLYHILYLHNFSTTKVRFPSFSMTFSDSLSEQLAFKHIFSWL